MTQHPKKNGTDVDDDGLPVEPERRRAAVDAQFDPFTAELAALDDSGPATRERNMDDPDPRADAYRDELELVEAALLDVVRYHARALGPRLVAHAVIEVCGSVCVDVVRSMPEIAADVDDKLGAVRLFVLATTGRPQ